MGQFLNKFDTVVWWGASGGRLAAGDVTLSAYAPINYRVPLPFPQGGSMTPPATDYNSYLYYNDRRMCAFGSNHPGGANFTLADGAVRFLRQTTALVTLTQLAVRNDGQTVVFD
jgi:prepilin-type processing-associated H-X9-DG protein